MPRKLFILSAAGKVAAVLLWPWDFLRFAAVALFFGPDLVGLYNLFVPSGQWLCPVLTRFATERAEIWLTIDDGPDEEDTPKILDLLDRHRARATFFLVGERAARLPGIVAEILRRGHEVGHHTHTHPLGSFWCAGPARLNRELAEALAAFQRAGARPRWFRAPTGIKNLFLSDALKAHGMRCVGWSVRSYDTLARDPDRVVRRVMGRVRPGSIVLMHVGASMDLRVRVRAVERVLAALEAKGIACVIPEAGALR